MMNKVPNPWLGLRSYHEGETIHGRTEEIAVLSQLVLATPQTVVYGRSGIGKTSIINAGIFPIVRKKGVFPVSIRLEHNSEPYITQISREIQLSLKHLRKDVFDENGEKRPIHEVGIMRETTEAVREQESLWEFFHRHEFYDSKGNRIKPLVVFDQFEEIFTLEKDRTKVKSFFSELGDLLNGVVPDYITQAADAYAEKPNQKTIEDDAGFSFIDLGSVSNKIGEYLTSSDFHIVITLREDFLSYLERDIPHIPSLRQNRYCLQPINEEQAASIIMNPIKGLVGKDVAKLIIEKVTGESDFLLDGKPEIQVDSAILSLYLSRLYDGLDDNVDKITGSIVEDKTDNIIADFYRAAVSDIPDEIINFLEDHLVNGEGRRENISEYSAVNDGHLTAEILRTLINDRKVLREFEYVGVRRIEFIHDVLCPVIVQRKESREMRKIRDAMEQEKKSLNETRAKNRIVAFVLSLAAIFLAVIAVVIVSMRLNSKRQQRELSALGSEIKEILPSVIEQSIKDGDTFTARALFLRLFSDTLFNKNNPVNQILLRQLSASGAIILKGHARAVNVVRFSPDGIIAASGSDDGTVRIWNTKDGSQLSTVLVGESSVTSLAFSSDGETIVFSTKDGCVGILSKQDGWRNIIRDDYLEKTYARFVTFTPDDSGIIVCCVNGFVDYFQSSDLDKVEKVKTAKEGLTFIAFDKEGKRAALAGADKTIALVDVAKKSLIRTLVGHTDWVRSVCFSPDGNYLVSGADDGKVLLWNIATSQYSVIEEFSDWITGVSFSPDGSRVVSSSRDGSLRIADVATCSDISSLQIKHSGYLSSFDISADGRRVITSSTDPVVHIWDCGEILDTGLSMRQPGEIHGLSCIPGTTWLASASSNGTVCVWDYASGSLIYEKHLEKARIEALTVSPDGRYIAVSDRFKVRLFWAKSGEELDLDNTDGHRSWIRNLRFSHDGKTLASVGEDARMVLWDVETRKTRMAKSGLHSSGIYAVDFSHNDSLIVTGSSDKTIRRWTADSISSVGEPIVGHTNMVNSVHFSDDDRMILSASGDQTVCLWALDGSLIRQFVGSSGYTSEAIFSNDCTEVFSASSDRTVRIWHIDSGKEAVRLDGHLAAISGLFIDSNDFLVSSDYSGLIKVWKIPSLESVAEDL